MTAAILPLPTQGTNDCFFFRPNRANELIYVNRHADQR